MKLSIGTKMDLISSLKSSTSKYHYEIEQTDLLKKIVTNDITLPEYKILLCKLYGFISPCERVINQVYPKAIAGREKSSLLHIDLIELDCDIDDDFLFCSNTPDLNTVHEILGYLYVLEGSTLGGKVITKLLKHNSKLSPDISQRYFNAYGERTKKNWDIFLKSLIEQNFTNIEKDMIIKSAISTFSCLSHWLKF